MTVRTARRTIVIAIACVLLANATAALMSQGQANAWRCLQRSIEPCFTHRGRLSGQNGVARMLWLVGTNRIVRIDYTDMPPMLDTYLDMASPQHGDVFGDFDVCRLQPDQPGHMRSACIAGARRLVVQDRERKRPAMQLLETWPAGER